MAEESLRVRTVPVASLTPDPTNVRTHSAQNLKAICRSLEAFGQRKPLVCCRSGADTIVIAGNGTLDAARALGWEKIAVTVVPADWDTDKARAYAIADNRTAELADWDAIELKSALYDLEAAGWDPEVVGFEALAPPADPRDEWTGMPDFDQDDRLAAFHVTVNFATEDDADEFFSLISCPKRARMWWPDAGGVVGSDTKQAWQAEDGDEGGAE